MHGWKARIGVITTSVNTVVEPEFHELAPDGVTIATSRLRHGGKTSEENTNSMNEDVNRCAELLATANPDAVLYGVTAGSFLNGREYEEEMSETITDIAGAPAITASSSIRRALETLGAERVSVATPYIPKFDDRLESYLREFGYTVAAMDGHTIEEGFEIAAVHPEAIYRAVKRADRPEADAVVISGTNYRTMEVIEDLEADLGKPVVSANTASLWDVLTTVGVDPATVSCGELFERAD
ncbi:maleate cis-trans isomerase family protein [Halovivax limisalsi]|uniref:maleate cis-trans isomerase family protein n=1 Tax=Halovivax limisalsi TaxID=1453760 RepID=UPI001FFCFB2D|nr:maleate cis-trans isomerase [Halovivax limisalsi]